MRKPKFYFRYFTKFPQIFAIPRLRSIKSNFEYADGNSKKKNLESEFRKKKFFLKRGGGGEKINISAARRYLIC